MKASPCLAPAGVCSCAVHTVLPLYLFGQSKILGNQCLQVSFELLNSVRDLTSTWMPQVVGLWVTWSLIIAFQGDFWFAGVPSMCLLPSSFSERPTFLSSGLPPDLSLGPSPSSHPPHFSTLHPWYLHLCLWLNTQGPVTPNPTCLWSNSILPLSNSSLPSSSTARPWMDHLFFKPTPPVKHSQGYSLVFLIQKYRIRWGF